ncbi:hypothetical protein I8J32_007790 [Lysobacter solisilvae]|uniref:Teneurin-like YD-shell domain-containing protein n=2 Tax=Agrilutibacter solisilvae TaxID=2763317 RepID=A0A975ATG2_9GAMM|nr:hypothetical protein I8J32_007790 [Lysobacter solisilvae]
MGTSTNIIKYQHTDALGSPVVITDAGGNIIERSKFEPYGLLINRPLQNGPGYTGHVSDKETGLSYMQQRYYDPGIGRMLSVDPVTANPNTGAKFNRYAYGLNNPYRFTDPDGRDDLDMFALTDPLRVPALRFSMPGWFTVMGHGGYAGTTEYALRNDAGKLVPFTGPRLNAEYTANAIKQAGFENWKYGGVFFGALPRRNYCN